MDKLCKSEFWNSNLTWYTNDPDFTPCFKGTILMWIPCIFLWIFLPLQLYNLKKSKHRDIPWNCFNTIKMVLIVITAILTLLRIIYELKSTNYEPEIYLYSNIIYLLTIVLFLTLTYSCVKMGIRSSGILLAYSFICLICELPAFKSAILSLNTLWTMNKIKVDNLSSITSYSANIVIFFLNCFSDEKPRHPLYVKEKNAINTKDISFLSDIFLTWMDPYFWKIYKKPTNKISWYHHFKNDGSENLLSKKKNSVEISNNISILKLLNNKYGSLFWYTTFLCILNESLNVGEFVVLHLFLYEIQTNQPVWKCYMFMVLLIMMISSQTFIISRYWKWCSKLEIKAKNATLITLYEKALLISSRSRIEYSTSAIVNMMSMNVNQLQSTPKNVHWLSAQLVNVVLTYIYLGVIFGPSIWFSVTIFILLLVLSYYVSIHLKKLQREALKHKEIRNRFMHEIFSGIKVLKMYAWEPSFKNSADKLRQDEEKNLKRIRHVFLRLQIIFGLAPGLLFVSTLIGPFIFNPNHPIGIIETLMAIIMFTILRNYLDLFPTYYQSILQGLMAAKKIDEFLSTEELDPNSVSHDCTVQPILLMRNATFSWVSDQGPAMLQNLNVQINKGELVAVVGSVGAGKSSFISACLGEMYRMSGYANTKGSVAYVPQQAWILNTSFKTNITLSDDTHYDLYQKSLKACALNHDINTFSGGDTTEIGEKGINLSGGQKQRISLARAIYQNADVYYFDDPLSALDSQVANHVFHEAIGPKSILTGKTRILITHSAKFFPFADRIILMNNGLIVESGTYDELLSKNKDFAEFAQKNSQETGQKGNNIFDEYFIDENFTSKEEEFHMDLKNRKDCDVTRTQNPTSGKLIEEEIIPIDEVYKRFLSFYISTFGIFLTVGTITLFLIGNIIAYTSGSYVGVWMNSDHYWDEKYTFLAIYISSRIIAVLVMQFGFNRVLKGTKEISTILYNKLLDSVLRWPMYLFDTTPMGRIISRFSDDIFVLDNIIGNITNQALTLMCGTIVLFATSIFFVPESSVIFIPSMFVFYGVQVLYSPMHHKMRRMEAVQRSSLYSHLVESVAGHQSIRAYKLENKFIELTKEKNSYCSSAYYFSNMCPNWLFNRCEILGAICYTLILILSVSIKDERSFPYLTTLLTLAIVVFKTMGIRIIVPNSLAEHILPIERVKQYIKQPREHSWSKSLTELDENWPQNGEIVFQDYKLQYRIGLEYVLKGINLQIRSGEKVGIIGRTGAGKSSILLGLFRIVEPASGTIFIDGVDITKLGLHVLRSKITVIPQDPVLFSGTLRFNLDPFKKHDDASLWKVLEKSHLKQYVTGLDEGINHVLDEGGKNLSFGQKQLICLARALLRKTKILVLDEATASVDVKTDELIQKTIRQEFFDCTVITIAHRLNTLQHYDKILIMDEGKVVQYDTVENLMKSHDFSINSL